MLGLCPNYVMANPLSSNVRSEAGVCDLLRCCRRQLAGCRRFRARAWSSRQCGVMPIVTVADWAPAVQLETPVTFAETPAYLKHVLMAAQRWIEAAVLTLLRKPRRIIANHILMDQIISKMITDG